MHLFETVQRSGRLQVVVVELTPKRRDRALRLPQKKSRVLAPHLARKTLSQRSILYVARHLRLDSISNYNQSGCMLAGARKSSAHADLHAIVLECGWDAVASKLVGDAVFC